MVNCRSDVALEEVEIDYNFDVNRKIYGMNLKKLYVDKVLSKKIKKNEGVYYNLDEIDVKKKKKEVVSVVKSILLDIFDKYEKMDILVIGLGNRYITCDSLGPSVINKINVNRHLNEGLVSVCAMAPGVLGKTGLDTCDVVKSLVNEFKPNIVIVVDALAARHLNRMCTSIQIATCGISPGSGVYQNRKELSKKTLGADVIAIGVPTVCDINSINDEYENDFFITPNSIDSKIEIISDIIAMAINKAIEKRI